MKPEAAGRIDTLFREKKREGKTALILYLTAGYPDLETTEALIPELEQAGADLIELGVPFSDPIADGPTIQKASTLSINAGATLKKIMALVKRLRTKTRIPILLFSAFNPIWKHGLEKTVTDCARIGIDGLLVPDLPPEEADDLISLCEGKNLSHVFLIAPTTPLDRARRIAGKCTGFIYYISTKGVTGARKNLDGTITPHLRELKNLTSKPVAVGFGISKPEHVRALKKSAEGVVVGSALIREVQAGKNLQDRIRRAVRFTRKLAGAL